MRTDENASLGEQLLPGSEWEFVLTDDLTRTQIVQYAGASGDFNPLHTDEVYAREVAGYDGIFAHGMLSMGMLGQAVAALVGPGRMTRYGVRFRHQVWPGDRLTAHVRLDDLPEPDGTGVLEFQLTVRNQDGVDVVTGYARATPDGPPSG